MAKESFFRIPFETFRVQHSRERDELLDRLGEFMDTFSFVEGIMFFAVAGYAKLDWRVAKAILSPLRVENAISTLNRLIEALGLKGNRVKELKALLTQLGEINKTRNDILHHGLWQDFPAPNTKKFMVTNALLARSPKTVIRYPVTSQNLTAMSEDLTQIALRVLSSHCGNEKPTEPEVIAFFRAFRRAYPLGSPVTWRYKPPSRATSRRRRGALPKQQRPKKASRGSGTSGAPRGA